MVVALGAGMGKGGLHGRNIEGHVRLLRERGMNEHRRQ